MITFRVFVAFQDAMAFLLALDEPTGTRQLSPTVRRISYQGGAFFDIDADFVSATTAYFRNIYYHESVGRRLAESTGINATVDLSADTIRLRTDLLVAMTAADDAVNIERLLSDEALGFGVEGRIIVDTGGGTDMLDTLTQLNTARAVRDSTGTVRFTLRDGTPVEVRNAESFLFAGVSRAFDDIAAALDGTALANRLTGGDGHDTLRGFDGNDTLRGGGGFDVLRGGNGRDVLVGEAGNDWLYGDADNDWLAGGDGADRLFGGTGLDTLLGGEGSDTLDGGTGNDILDGGGGADVLLGGDGDDTLLGGDGADRMDGGAGNDSLSGSALSDTLTGGTGHDTVLGGDGADRLVGGDGDDRLSGEAGNDIITGDAGADRLDGGADNDWLRGDAGRDTLVGGDGDDTLLGGADDDALNGGAGNDSLDGGTGNDWLSGLDGNDVLLGGDGRDTLLGGVGNDFIRGGLGPDLLTGGPGGDRFVFATPAESGPGTLRDTISDFTPGDDILDLSPMLGATRFRFAADGVLTVGTPSVRWLAVQKVVQGDANGDGVVDFAIAVTTPRALIEADFLL